MKKNILLLFLFVACFSSSFAQQIIIFPSDNWMKKNGFGMEADVQGQAQFVCDYGKALRTSSELKDIITRFGKLFRSQGFEITPLDNALKEIGLENALNSVQDLEQSPTELILTSVSPDIKIDLSWDVTTEGFYKKVDINVEASDPYTGSQISAISFTSPEPTKYLDLKSEVETMLKGDFTNFMNDMKAAIEDRVQNGQKLMVSVQTQSDADTKLTTMIGGKPLSTLIRNFLQNYAKNHKIGKAVGSSTKFTYRDVRVEMDPNAAQDLQDALVNYIQNDLGIDCYAPMLRLGTVPVYLGKNPN